ncbi:MAG: hypothetical protein CMP21_08760 [Rickettsiales bacterium]|nr:hypothetical protein [Rickettsiales bacterium]|tara:strand:- start:768 stop:1187 length:420 start_codon:yes stop_codon:yes gene_type:complete
MEDKEKINSTDVLTEEKLEEEKNTSNSRSLTEIPSEIDSGRDHRGRFVKGNKISKGRPKKENTIVTQFRDNPRNFDLIENMIKIASTLGQKDQHKDAMACAKLVVERLVPALKSSELKVGSNDSAFVFLPPQSEPESEE